MDRTGQRLQKHFRKRLQATLRESERDISGRIERAICIYTCHSLRRHSRSVFSDLEELFRTGGQVADTKYVFLGDFVDRGSYSLEALTILLLLKLKYSDRIVLLRDKKLTLFRNSFD